MKEARALDRGVDTVAEPADAAPTRESERAALVKEVGDCCQGSDPLCAGGCLVEKAIRARAGIVECYQCGPQQLAEGKCECVRKRYSRVI